MKTLSTFITLLLFILGVHAQEITISGTVSDDGEPLPGANILIKNSEIVVVSDFNGNYKIKAAATDTLVFTYVGFKSKEILVNAQTTINVILEYSSELDEVVVRGMGSIREKKTLGYAVSTVSSKLEGKAAGARVSEVKPSSGILENDPAYGQLTAGEINDVEKYAEFVKIYTSGEAREIAKKWEFNHDGRTDIQVTDNSGLPIANVGVALYKNYNLLMKGMTDASGMSMLFKGKNSPTDTYLVQLYYSGKIEGKKISRNQKQVSFTINEHQASNAIDILFAVDATGSMGDEISYLKSELKNIMSRIDASVKQKRVALTVYRDHGDDYVTRAIDFSSDVNEVKDFLSAQHAAGGGDYKEAVEEALKVSLSQSWNEKAKARILFLMLDAPPHFNQENVAMIKSQIAKAKEQGIKIIPVVASGANKEVEFLMRSFSVSTNGTYVFLTDDSGIGNDHIEATTESFKVEKLNDLMVRLIEQYAGVQTAV
ncbi:von Willebrand factor type A domain-containing protein [Dokdonia sp. Hel_I_63]|uniref:vWA domain-containing protein n=1 Tax=Dokdonia sp. Hel_I_63 TaxID=1249996 RepID=UPI00119BE341|nr:vWA domain-containing protein [Dokdonia sp. Hel_I_63]TVZ22542.1 von Willebrand factor type A domain-containing protein [Dokdonia sp. Hel_I_63]